MVATKFTCKKLFGMKKNSVVLTASDAGWINGHNYALFGPLAIGATTILMERPISLLDEIFLKKLTEKLYLIPSFVSRSADKVLYKLKESSSANDELLEIRTISEKFIKSNENREHVIEETFNSCIRDSWEIKKNMTGVMSGILNDQYKELQKLPLNWIRLLGAGSGGYFLISTKLDNQTTEEELSKLGMKDFFQASMSQSGLEIIHDC